MEAGREAGMEAGREAGREVKPGGPDLRVPSHSLPPRQPSSAKGSGMTFHAHHTQHSILQNTHREFA